ncbi:hypothetical protein NC653_023030 [Populus alba x Populus x berolinensis]|uniref:Uncharacterized protein n=1 Tax=Populus alba x Populus x berolinensis TaxID=444605 RepID=A0AAD6MGS7_9ROSI|nr:hypothetical protein NC653_023030 [Populus alba x Populus x berolinensis]
MDAWKSLSVFAILFFLILFISSGKMFLQRFNPVLLYFLLAKVARRCWQMLLANERNHCMEVSVKKMKAIKDVWPSMALAIMHIANSYS